MDVLLIEPNYKAKYPPLGLMKISTFHKGKKDNVYFFKGIEKQYYDLFEKKKWNRVYISTVFTYDYKKSLDSIDLAKKIVRNQNNIFVGGVAATLLADKYYEDTGITTIKGLLDEEGKLKIKDDSKIDSMIPDYSILEQTSYEYPTSDAYIGYATRGCIRKCPFCAVPTLEPVYCHYKDLKVYVNEIKEKYGPKKNLLLMDNNVLASKNFPQIIDDIIDLEFEKDAKINGKKRYVDFNQGLDGRLFKEKQAKLLSKIAIRPARIAFDHINLYDLYVEKIKLAAQHDILNLSNYLLFNYDDKPVDLYKRIKVNIQLNEKLGTSIFSFPMKYVPLDSTDRSFVGKYWTKKQLRAIQVILNVTHGLVGPKRKFVMKAFGKSENKYERLLWMPEPLIAYRESTKKQEAADWINLFDDLLKPEKKDLKKIIKHNIVDKELFQQKKTPKIEKIIKYYPMLLKRAGFSPNQKGLFEF